MFIHVYTYIQTQWIHTVKKSTQRNITTYMIKFTNRIWSRVIFLYNSQFKKLILTH